jgi:hypothetical protein
MTTNFRTQVRTGQQIYEIRKAIITRIKNENVQATGAIERDERIQEEKKIAHVMNATFIKQREERAEKMLMQTLKTIL